MSIGVAGLQKWAQQNANPNRWHLPISESLIFDGIVRISPKIANKSRAFRCRKIANKMDHKTLSDVYVELRTP